VKFNMEESVSKSTLLISNNTAKLVTADELNPFASWPIEVGRVSLMTNDMQELAAVGERMAEALSEPPRYSMTFMMLDPTTAALLDKAFSSSFYQRSLAGPSVIFPDRLLNNFVSIGIVPFKFKHPLAGWVESGPRSHSYLLNIGH